MVKSSGNGQMDAKIFPVSRPLLCWNELNRKSYRVRPRLVQVGNFQPDDAKSDGRALVRNAKGSKKWSRRPGSFKKNCLDLHVSIEWQDSWANVQLSQRSWRKSATRITLIFRLQGHPNDINIHVDRIRSAGWFIIASRKRAFRKIPLLAKLRGKAIGSI